MTTGKILLLDCDGTIREPVSGSKFIQRPLDQKIIDGADKAIAFHSSKGYTCIGITNQGGVELGHKDLEDAIAEQIYTLELLPRITAIYFCPDFEGQQCWLVKRGIETKQVHLAPWAVDLIGTFRKPGPGMLKAAIRMHASEDPTVWMIGDRKEDEEAAMRAGVKFLPADTWLNRFRPGIHATNATPEQIEFLEGIELSEQNGIR